jgi:hypothetical protein
MGGLTLLDRARAAGLSVTADSDRLVIKGPRRAEEVARELIEQKAEVLALLAVPVEPLIEPPVEDPAKRPPPPPGLVAPRRTPWGTVAYSAPDSPSIEVFGPPPPWPVLAAERWGLSVGDPTPGVINDRPDHEWMCATLDATVRIADPFAAAERAALRAEPPNEDLASLRAVLADWPIPWRERWGRRANELAEQGIPFPEDERRAFVEVQAEKAGGAEPPPIKTPSSIEMPPTV